MKPTLNPALVNPQLEGRSFFWEGGPVGVLLSHGYTATSAEVRPLAEVLHQRGYTVAGPLLPGHGTTPEDLNRCQWQDWAGAVEDTYQQLARRCEQVFVGGESMGGLLALYLASNHPEVVGVLTYAPALMVKPRLNSLIAPLIAPFIRARPKPVQAPSPSDARWQGYSENPLAAAAQMFRLQGVVRRRLPLIRRPLLVIQGRLDPSLDPRGPELLARSVSSVIKEIYWLEDSHHCVILDGEWEQASRLTLQFIEHVLNPRG